MNLTDAELLAKLDFDCRIPCEVGVCKTETPEVAAAILDCNQGCPCDGHYPVCKHHADLIAILRQIHCPIVCKEHQVKVCAHDAYTIRPIPQ